MALDKPVMTSSPINNPFAPADKSARGREMHSIMANTVSKTKSNVNQVMPLEKNRAITNSNIPTDPNITGIPMKTKTGLIKKK